MALDVTRVVAVNTLAKRQNGGLILRSRKPLRFALASLANSGAGRGGANAGHRKYGDPLDRTRRDCDAFGVTATA